MNSSFTILSFLEKHKHDIYNSSIVHNTDIILEKKSILKGKFSFFKSIF